VSLETEIRATDRGAEGGPPVAIRAKTRELPRLGPLAEPSLVDRLRASWNLADLVPTLDPRTFTAREWRRAAALALVAHAVVLVTVIVGSQYGLFDTHGAPERPDIVDVWLPQNEVARADTNTPAPEGGGDPGGDGSPEASGGGGSNTAEPPVTRGEIPSSTPAPVLPPLVTPPVVQQPSLPMTPMVQGPDVAVPIPAQVGLPGAPPAPPGDPGSPGNQGGVGVGTGPGNGGGDGGNQGRDGGPGGPGTGTRNGTPTGGQPGSGDTPGDSNGPGVRGPAPVANRSLRLARKVKPTPTSAMIEARTFGTVTFQVTVDAKGNIVNVRTIQPLPNGGTEAALAALYKCTFLPAIRNGQYVAETTQVRFDIRQQ
jgi:hypothetical protein